MSGVLEPAGAQLTVDGTIFCVNGELTCDSVAVQNGAMAEFICAWALKPRDTAAFPASIARANSSVEFRPNCARA